LSEGTNILRSNNRDWTDEQLWKTYIQLTEAEAALRIQKSDLCIRPIWHHQQDRIKAHFLICFLAYVLWKTLQQWQSRAGLGRRSCSPQSVHEFTLVHRVSKGWRGWIAAFAGMTEPSCLRGEIEFSYKNTKAKDTGIAMFLAFVTRRRVKVILRAC